MKTGANHFQFVILLLLSGLVALVDKARADGGVPLWTNYYGELGAGGSHAAAVTTDANGNIFVTGYMLSPSGDVGNIATVAYSSEGQPLWTNRYGGSASALTVDSHGNVFVTGHDSVWRCVTLAYSGTGIPLWTNLYSGPGNSVGYAIACGPGSVFVTGSDFGYVTLAYSTDGVPLWTNHYSFSATSYAEGNGLALDSSGNVFSTGYSQGAKGINM